MRTLAHPRALARRPVRALLAQWPLALVGDVEGIHQARVASRRIRELVPAVRDHVVRERAAADRAVRARIARVDVNRCVQAVRVLGATGSGSGRSDQGRHVNSDPASASYW